MGAGGWGCTAGKNKDVLSSKSKKQTNTMGPEAVSYKQDFGFKVIYDVFLNP